MEQMKLTFINVGYGEAIYLECPDPAFSQGMFTMLIDGGSGEAAEYADKSTGRVPLAEYLARQGSGHLDVLVNTHIHEDHLCGLVPVAETLPPREFWQTLSVEFPLPVCPQEGTESDSLRKFKQALADCRRLRESLPEKGCRLRQMLAGDAWHPLCRGLSARILGPDAADIARLERLLTQVGGENDPAERVALLTELDAGMNNFSMILQLDYHGVRILLPGDTNYLGYAGFEEKLSSRIFKVGHHGQRDGVSEEIFAKIAPSHVVCCASSDRRYNSAEPGILHMMANGGATLWFSDCPVADVAPHSSLSFAIGEDGEISACYGT